jgi:hypothetical protein
MAGKPTYETPYVTEESIEDLNANPLDRLCAYETVAENLFYCHERQLVIDEYAREIWIEIRDSLASDDITLDELCVAVRQLLIRRKIL